MATVTKTGVPSICSVLPPATNRITELLAGEAIAAGDTLYVKSDGKVWKTNGTAATAPALYVGVAAAAASVGEAVTPYHGVTVRYGSGLTPGARYFVSATPGLIDDAATTGGTVAIAVAVDDTRIFFFNPTR
jgi:hypothetical protein